MSTLVNSFSMSVTVAGLEEIIGINFFQLIGWTLDTPGIASCSNKPGTIKVETHQHDSISYSL